MLVAYHEKHLQVGTARLETPTSRPLQIWSSRQSRPMRVQRVGPSCSRQISRTLS